MRVRIRAAVVLVTAVGLGLVGSAQQPPPSAPPQRPPQGRMPAVPTTGGPQRPARDPRLQQPTTGTGVVSGRVVDAATGQPLQRVRVRYMGREGRSTLTDAQGAFTFTKLPRGGVMLMAEKSSYLITSFPERRGTMRNAMLMLADGQKVDNVTIPMTRSSAVVGRLVDQFGDPVEGVNIQALSAGSTRRAPNRMFGGPMSRMGLTSNDIGEFRIARLEPGTYYLLASPQRRQDEEGSAIGRTFYPGVPSIEQAQMITVEKGQTLTGVEFPMLETTLVKVMGTVLSASGQEVTGGSLAARSPAPPGMSMPMGMGMFDGSTNIRNDGTFELRLQPGDYTIEAMPMAATAPGQMQSTRERGQVKLSVGAEPIQNLVITAGAGATASGKFVFNGRKAPPTDLRNAQVNFTSLASTVGFGFSADECRAMGMGGPSRPTVNPDGTFVAENLWGACVVRAGNVQGWQLEAVMHRGNDVTSRPIQFDAGRQVTDLQLVFTDRVGDLSLDVQDERGMPIAEYVAIVFPIEKEKWSDQRFVRTHVASAAMDQAMAGRTVTTGPPMSIDGVTISGPVATVTSTSQTGQAIPGAGVSRPPIVKGLLAGEYYAVVVDDIGYEDLRDPEFLAQLANVATRVTIAEGDAHPLQLRRVPVPEAR